MKTIQLYALLFISLVYISCDNEDVGDAKIKNDAKVELAKSEWVAQINEFKPAPGQFQNEEPQKSLIQVGESILGETEQYISLGVFGGYVVFNFNGAMLNKTGEDLAIFGNSFENNSEPASIQVSFDENQDGKPNDKWYELKGSEYHKAETIKNYEITYSRLDDDDHKIKWEDNQGKSGIYDFNIVKTWHPQAMYPLSYPNSVTFKGTKLKNNVCMIDHPAHGRIVAWPGYDWGYADNKGYENEGDFEKADFVDFSNAVDENGKSVNLKYVSFVKIYNSVSPSDELGITRIGNRSAEILKVKYLHFE
ncbi:MAG: hypothetical protein N4A49_09215 [Marinifilaceae bacterium]|jgi:hypothetical protein|nr:hypothetical protein [Marinifilaceae bacterium]